MFHVKGGDVLHLILPSCPKSIDTKTKVEYWIGAVAKSAPLISVGRLVTRDVGLNMNPEHFHTFSIDEWHGHYHRDTTPDKIKYEAFFTVVERVIRVDRPQNGFKFD